MKLIVTLSLLLLTTPALAGTFSAPDGCKAYLTVQSRGCMVSHFYTCEKDAKGEQWRADFDDMGPFFLSRIDSEAQWLESYESDGSGSGLTTKETMDANPKDAASQFLLAYHCLVLDDRKQAVDLLNRVVQLNPQDKLAEAMAQAIGQSLAPVADDRPKISQ